MAAHRFVVLPDCVRGFETLEEAERFALSNVPAAICERVRSGETSTLVDIMRHDFNYDAERDEWRVMLA